MTDLVTVTLRQRPFIDLFSDAVRYSGLAHIQSAPADLRAAGAKACVLHCVLSMEGAINGILADLDFSLELKKMADRFQPLEKYEFALSFISEKKLDRGSSVVQSVAQLFRIRNEYVHSKSRSKTGDYSKKERIIDFPHEEFEHVHIPKEPRRWNYGDAKTALGATDSFLTYFFIDLCCWTPRNTMATLLPVLETPEGPKQVFVTEHREVLLRANEGMALPMAFLDLDRPIEEYITDQYGKV